MLPAGKSKGKGKGKGKGKPRNSAASDHSDADVSPLVYDDLLATYLSARSASPESTSNGNGGGVQIPQLSALVTLQQDLKSLATKAQARVLRSQKLLRDIESQRTKALARAQEADNAAAAAAAAAKERAEQLQLEEEAKKRKLEELEIASKQSTTPAKPPAVKEEDSESRISSPQEKKRRLEERSPTPTPTASVVGTKPSSPSVVTAAIGASDAADDSEPRAGPFMKNPESEYVSVQTIPTAALAFMEDTYDDQIPASGTEDLKKRYGVASYPTKDLADLLPGEIPDEDFSRAKPANQVQFSTFQSYIEPYFRPFVEEDLSFLNERQDNLTPYLVPPLGPNYQEVWADEDGSAATFSPAPTNSQADSATSARMLLPRGTSEHLTEDQLETEDISCGPLASRILSALLKDESEDTILPNSTTATPGPGTTTPSKPEDDSTAAAEPQVLSSSSAFAEQQGWRVSSVKADYQTLEDRLKREFKFVGILGDEEVDWSAREDDEVCAELRRLQKRLKVISVINAARKKKVEKIVHEHMAYQEYTQILEDLDKQVDQAYMKRTRTIKNKKKRLPGNSTPSGAAGGGGGGRTADLGEGIKALLDKRKRWIEKIGPVFPAAEVMKRIPRKSIFEDVDGVEKNETTNGDKVDGVAAVVETQA
ncbi:histone acetyltransferases subunit 3-domain-containing protein [Lipomyces tetrasporus]|uniref:Histone acetyltransferases subunit 3-domain-containing protein n=1 Tax=Lipomyces tetrasporus TaxID=54092 RepID=A0AAD7QLH6_9ASCO|nr:histone acetyltransferases subunit 3-domain-containing protein [Lipomyces tetrasporus]KAJ8097378.1 histone acetyltransferases subunit 3-domain-containing protein [Lipomyces tetrasporus]